MRIPALAIAAIAAAQMIPQSKAEENNTDGVWSAKMRRFAEVLTHLAPELATDHVRDADQLKENAQALSQLAHSMEGAKGNALLKKDPGAAYILSSLERDVTRAAELMDSGNYVYGKALLRSATGHCIACHTRSASGPQFASLVMPDSLKELPALERADFLASMRQFDRALDEYKKVIADGALARKNPFSWERALRQSLSISARVKRDPTLTLAILDVAGAQGIPSFIARTIGVWKTQAMSWKKSEKKESSALNTVQLLALAEKLISKGESAQQYPADHSGDLYFFRASSYLHEYLEKSASPSRGATLERARALSRLGVASEHLRDLYLWTTHEFYYEDCVRQAPGTDVARDCFGRLESSTFRGYTGSRGTQMPKAVQKHLEELKALSAKK